MREETGLKTRDGGVAKVMKSCTLRFCLAFKAKVICQNIQRFVLALQSFYMWLISLQVVVRVSWQADLTKASARNCEQHFLLALTYAKP